MVKKGIYKKAIAAIVAVLLMGTTCAVATEYWGWDTKVSAGSYNGRHASYMDDGFRDLSARRNIILEPNKNVLAGHIGVNARGFDANSRELIKASGFSYTRVAAVGLDTSVYLDGYKDYAFSKGLTRLWDGRAYVTFETYDSPNARVQKAKANQTAEVQETRINFRGETYGSVINATDFESEPDLILAQGKDGESGYVKKADLYNDSVTTPEEAVQYMNSKKARQVTKIPLYESDGTTVIGSFELDSTAGAEPIVE